MNHHEIITLSKGSYSGVEESFTKVIHSANDFQQLWNTHASTESSPVNEINFDTEMVVWISLGMKNSGGYDVEIVDFSDIDNESKLVITCLQSSPAPGGMVTCALTQPYHVVKIPKSKKEVRFEIKDKLIPAKPLRLILTFHDGADKEQIMKSVEDYPSVTSTQLLRAVGIGMVDFDTTVQSYDAMKMMEDIEGVATVERD